MADLTRFDVTVWRDDRAHPDERLVRRTTVLALNEAGARRQAVGAALVELRRLNGRKKLGHVPLVADVVDLGPAAASVNPELAADRSA
jgi:hypothetical protein